MAGIGGIDGLPGMSGLQGMLDLGSLALSGIDFSDMEGLAGRSSDFQVNDIRLCPRQHLMFKQQMCSGKRSGK